MPEDIPEVLHVAGCLDTDNCECWKVATHSLFCDRRLAVKRNGKTGGVFVACKGCDFTDKVPSPHLNKYVYGDL